MADLASGSEAAAEVVLPKESMLLIQSIFSFLVAFSTRPIMRTKRKDQDAIHQGRSGELRQDRGPL